jgi:hypothetical protein
VDGERPPAAVSDAVQEARLQSGRMITLGDRAETAG